MKKNQPKKSRTKPTKAKKKAKGKTKPGADPTQPVVHGLSTPAWSEVYLGTLGGDTSVNIPVPLNEAAVKEMSPLAGVALVLHRRIAELEEKVKLLERDLNLHHRIARLEAALGEGPGSSDDED